jgi:prophage regulatory protein
MNKQFISQYRRVLRPKQFADKYQMGLSSFWRHAKEDPDFPKPFKLSPRVTAIDADEADAWYAAKMGTRGTDDHCNHKGVARPCVQDGVEADSAGPEAA